jgi:tetratricopeptide (TPR) repeat protein
MSQIALYGGWYDQDVSGPFTRPTVEFRPGAFAYHLYSFSAGTLRSTSHSWVGTLLEKGATCTMGAVDEPYLIGTPDILVFVSRLTFQGFTFGEAAYAAQNWLSWQTTIVGDPLYQPFGRSLESLHRDLEKRGSKLLEWSHLLVVNRNLSIGSSLPELIRYLESFPIQRQSAVLTEKLGDLYWANGKLGDAVESYEAALHRAPSPQQTIRLLLKAAERRAIYGPDAKAYGHYETLIKEFPDYPDLLKVYQQMCLLAKRMKNTTEIERCEKEIKRLGPQPGAPRKS